MKKCLCVCLALGWILTAIGWANLDKIVVLEKDRFTKPELIRVKDVQQREDGVTLTMLDGSTREVAVTLLRGIFDAPPGPSVQVEPEACINAIQALRQGQRRFRLIEAELGQLIDQWQKELEMIRQGFMKYRSEWYPIEEFASLVFDEVYEPTTFYDEVELERIIRKGELRISAYPKAKEAIEKLLEPFRNDLAQLRAGKQKFQGQWVTPEELAEREAVRDRQVLQTPEQHLERISISGVMIETMPVILFLGGLGLLCLLILFLFFNDVLEIFRKGRRLRGLGGLVGMTAAAAIIWAFMMFLTSQRPGADTPGMAEDKELLRQIFLLETHKQDMVNEDPFAIGRSQTGRVPETLNQLVLTQAGVNYFLKHYVQIESPEKPSPLAVTRERLAVAFHPGEIVINEFGRFLGFPLVVQHRMIEGASVSGITQYRISTRVGMVPMPDLVRSVLWEKTATDLAQALSRFPAYSPQPPEKEGELILAYAGPRRKVLVKDPNRLTGLQVDDD